MRTKSRTKVERGMSFRVCGVTDFQIPCCLFSFLREELGSNFHSFQFLHLLNSFRLDSLDVHLIFEEKSGSIPSFHSHFHFFLMKLLPNISYVFCTFQCFYFSGVHYGKQLPVGMSSKTIISFPWDGVARLVNFELELISRHICRSLHDHDVMLLKREDIWNQNFHVNWTTTFISEFTKHQGVKEEEDGHETKRGAKSKQIPCRLMITIKVFYSDHNLLLSRQQSKWTFETHFSQRVVSNSREILPPEWKVVVCILLHTGSLSISTLNSNFVP